MRFFSDFLDFLDFVSDEGRKKTKSENLRRK